MSDPAMSDPAYWASRLRRFGHTGWADPAVYAYDQRLRLAAIGRAIDSMPDLAKDAALDFGCGVGDFCTLLAERFARVDGHDPVPQVLQAARERNAAANVHYLDVPELGVSRYDLVLCVTVLQHVVDDAELQALVGRLAGSLRPGGAFVVLETFAGRAAAAETATTRRRRAEDVVRLVDAAGLRLTGEQGFYHPSEAPTPAFLRYRHAWATRVLSRMAALGSRRAQRVLARRAVRAAAADDAWLDQPDSPTRLMVFRSHRGR